MDATPLPAHDEAAGTTERVYRGIMADIEQGRMVPGQRLIETDLATRFAAGRNAVREAMQRLAARGVVDLSRNRSPAIRRFERDETLEVLTVCAAMLELAATLAAERYEATRDAAALRDALDMLEAARDADMPATFSRARRQFYRTVLAIGGNRELQRVFPAIAMHIIYAQYQSQALRGIRVADYRAIADAIGRRDPVGAVDAARAHVERVRAVIMALADAS